MDPAVLATSTATFTVVAVNATDLPMSYQWFFNKTISGLMAAEPYHYRIVATNHGGIALGTDMIFETAAAVPPPIINAFGFQSNGPFWLQFDGTAGAGYSVLVSELTQKRRTQTNRRRPAQEGPAIRPCRVRASW